MYLVQYLVRVFVLKTVSYKDEIFIFQPLLYGGLKSAIFHQLVR